MKNIVIIENNEAKVSIKDIAHFSGVSERAILTTIRKNKVEFNRFGSLRLDKELSHMLHLLNEAETTFLLTLLKNTKEIVKFKSELVYQFYKMRGLTLESNKIELEKKEQELQNTKIELKKEKNKTRIYARKRQGNCQTVTNIIKEYDINITAEKLNDELFYRGLLDRSIREVYHYTSNLMSNGTPLLHTDTVLHIVDKLGYAREKGYLDAHSKLF